MTNRNLTTAKPGDTVRTVPGGVFKIIEITSRGSYVDIGFEGYESWLYTDAANGIVDKREPSVMDIAEIIPAPEPVSRIEELAGYIGERMDNGPNEQVGFVRKKTTTELLIDFANEIVKVRG